MDHSCPLTKNYVRGLSKFISDDVEILLYESLVDEYNELAARCETAGNDIKVVQLRAFVAIEIMYYWLTRLNTISLDPILYTTDSPPRSWQGLTKIARSHLHVKEEIEADQMERSIIGDHDVKNDIRLLRRMNENANVGLSSLIVESAVLLRRSLRRRDSEQIPRIGTYLAKACEVANEVPSRRVLYVRWLLDTTEEQSARAWER